MYRLYILYRCSFSTGGLFWLFLRFYILSSRGVSVSQNPSQNINTTCIYDCRNLQLLLWPSCLCANKSRSRGSWAATSALSTSEKGGEWRFKKCLDHLKLFIVHVGNYPLMNSFDKFQPSTLWLIFHQCKPFTSSMTCKKLLGLFQKAPVYLRGSCFFAGPPYWTLTTQPRGPSLWVL